MESVVDTLDRLKNTLRVTWSGETSSTKNWTPLNPSEGQCAVTSCLVQDYIGGDIVNVLATLPNGTTISHYYNSLYGADVDLTRDQFPKGTTFSEPRDKKGRFETTREYCLSFMDTERRYGLLKTKFLHLTNGFICGD